MTLTGKFALAALTALCIAGSPAVGAAGQHTTSPLPAVGKNCPASDEVTAALGKASAFMEESKYQDAVATLQPLSGLGCDPRVSLLFAAALEGRGDVTSAEQALQKAHSAWPSNASIATSLARLYLADKQVDRATQSLAHFKATATTPQQELELATVVYLAAHQLAAAQSVAEIAYKAHPSVHSLLLLANALQLQGRFKDVVRLLGDQRATYSQSADFLVTLAESEFDSVLYDTAQKDLEHAISLSQDSYQAHFLLGNVFLKLNEVDKAVAEYHLAIQLAPKQPRTYYQLAIALQLKHDEAAEEDMLQQALAVDSSYAPAHVELGRILMTQNRVSDAVTQLNMAIQYNPSSEQAYFLLAKAYAQMGQKDKSDEMAKRLIAVRNANWRSTQNMDNSQP
jgi:tetratricopeptide (TPR) repeat protein